MTDGENKNSEVIEVTILVVALSCTFLAIPILVKTLTYGALIPTFSSLYIVYFCYCACIIIFFHAVFFLINGSLRMRGSKFRKKVPKLIEYAYAVLISVSLLQIFFSSGRIADYLTLLAGDDQKMWDQIRDGARAHVKDDCSKPRDDSWFSKSYFTEEYCKEMQRIAEASDIKGYVFGTVIPNKDFLEHPIRKEYIPTLTATIPVDIPSPIVPMMELMYSREEYRKLPVNNATSNAFGWIALLLLPVGIALRLVKTSLELFGKLD